MFLHIGRDEIIPLDEIVAILNARVHLRKKNNSWMLNNNGNNSDNNLPDFHRISPKVKAIILMDNGQLYFSPIAAETLIKRITRTQSAQSAGLKYFKK